jgi:hypothetical protein
MTFTPSELGDPQVSGPEADPDDDDLENLWEFALGYSPTNHNDVPFFWAELRTVQEGGGTNDYATVLMRRRKIYEGIDYRVEACYNLPAGTWNSDEQTTTVVDVQPIDDLMEEAVWRVFPKLRPGVPVSVRTRIVLDP